MRKMKLAGMVLSVFWSLAFALQVQAESARPTAMEGIYVENINVSGMDENQIAQAVQSKMNELSQSRIDLYVGDAKATVTAADLGLTLANPNIVRQALETGQKGNVLQRYKALRILSEVGPLVLELHFTADAERIRMVVEEQCVPLNHSAVHLGLKRNGDGSFLMLKGKDGASVKVEESVETVQNFFSGEWRGGSAAVTLAVDVALAQGNAEQLALVKDSLGESSTDYSSSASSRRKNIETGVSKLNGTVLYPGEELSVTDRLIPFSAANGYELAPSYETGSVVDSYGGGICQVSTTLYLAVLRAELEVTERHNHSMLVAYVKPSMDAAIAEGSKDFRFRNNTDAPIYILGYTDGGEVGFVIYGHETRGGENRKVSYESETLSTMEPDTRIETDDSLDFGKKESGNGHTGKEAKLWKVVTVNGEEQSRDQVNSSSYQMTPNFTRVGIKGGNDEAVEAVQNAAASNDMSKVNEALARYPDGKSASVQSDDN